LTIVAAAADFGNRALAVARRYTASSAGSPSGSGLHAAPVATDISTSEAPTSRSFRWRRPETTHRRSIGNLALPETVVCSPTASGCAGTRTCAETSAKLAATRHPARPDMIDLISVSSAMHAHWSRGVPRNIVAADGSLWDVRELAGHAPANQLRMCPRFSCEYEGWTR
jgi:hypothetical protein